MSTKEFKPDEATDSIMIDGVRCRVQFTGAHYVLDLFGAKTLVCQSWWDILEARDNLEGRANSYQGFKP